MHLRYDDTLGAIDDERTVTSHQRHVDDINVLFFNIADRAQTGFFINIEYGQAQRHTQRGSEGHATGIAFFGVVFRLFEFVFDEVDFSFVGEVFDREDRRENFLQAAHFTLFCRNVHLQELFVGIFLNLDQVRHRRHFADLTERAADTLATCERVHDGGW